MDQDGDEFYDRDIRGTEYDVRKLKNDDNNGDDGATGGTEVEYDQNENVKNDRELRRKRDFKIKQIKERVKRRKERARTKAKAAKSKPASLSNGKEEKDEENENVLTKTVKETFGYTQLEVPVPQAEVVNIVKAPNDMVNFTNNDAVSIAMNESIYKDDTEAKEVAGIKNKEVNKNEVAYNTIAQTKDTELQENTAVSVIENLVNIVTNEGGDDYRISRKKEKLSKSRHVPLKDNIHVPIKEKEMNPVTITELPMSSTDVVGGIPEKAESTGETSSSAASATNARNENPDKILSLCQRGDWIVLEQILRNTRKTNLLLSWLSKQDQVS